MFTVRVLGLAVVSALVLTACSNGQTTSSSTGGTLSIATAADPTCLDPQQTGQLVSMDISRSLVDTLTDQDPESGKIVPWLAEKFSAVNGGRAFRFVLRPGVTFSDGTPVDSESV